MPVQFEIPASKYFMNVYFWFQENEKLKAEGVEKSKKIELLNDKISDLLQKNQRYLIDGPQIAINDL